jgi:hypothetical protein
MRPNRPARIRRMHPGARRKQSLSFLDGLMVRFSKARRLTPPDPGGALLLTDFAPHLYYRCIARTTSAPGKFLPLHKGPVHA